MAYKQPPKTPSPAKQAEMNEKGLAWDDSRKIWVKAWSGKGQKK